MDAEYLKRTVGPALSKGMAEVVSRQPGDAIDYLGNFLIHYADAQEAAAAAAAAAEQAEKEAAVQSALRAKRKERQDAEAAEKAALQARADELLVTLETVEEVDDALLNNVLQVIQSKTGSRAAYIGQRAVVEGDGAASSEDGNEEGGGPAEVLKYIAASEGSEFMLDQVLPKGQGVTFDAFKPPAAEGDEDEDPDADLDEDAPKKEVPKPGLFVENTLAEPRLHYFDFAKLGSYFAVPVQYNSFLHENAVSEESLKKFSDHEEAVAAAEEARAAREQAKAEAAAAKAAAAEQKAADAAAAAAAAGEDGAEGDAGQNENDGADDADGNAAADADADADAVDEEEEEEEEPEPVADPEYERVPVSLVLCMDTLGLGLDVYTAESLDLVRALAAALAAALERTERQQLENEFRALLSAQEENAKALESLDEVQRQQTEALEDDVATLRSKLGEEGVSEEDQAYEVLKLEEDAARRAVLLMQAQIKELERYKIAPKGDSLRALKAACFTLGYSKDAIVDRATKKLEWRKMRKLFGGDFFERLQAFDAEAVKKVHKYQTVAHIESLLDGITVESMNAKSVAVGAVLAWNQAVITVRKAAVEKRAREKAAAEAAEAAAAAEAAEAAAAAEAEGAAETGEAGEDAAAADGADDAAAAAAEGE